MPLHILPFLILLLTSCAGSRWAKDDPDYAAKYPRHTGDVGRTIKQAVDARHIAQKGGAYGTVHGRDEPTAMGAEGGLFRYPTPWLEGRVGLAGLIYEGDAPASAGLIAGARVQTPTRLAPFVGIGAYAGTGPDMDPTHDGIDNDLDFDVDEYDEAEDDFVFAMFPEAGCHFWLTPGWRITGSASYYITGNGAEDNFLTIGVSLACLTDLGIATNPKTLSKQAYDRGWRIGDGDSPAHSPAKYNAPSEPLVLPSSFEQPTGEAPPGPYDNLQPTSESP
jgi:hypothetical protein